MEGNEKRKGFDHNEYDKNFNLVCEANWFKSRYAPSSL